MTKTTVQWRDGFRHGIRGEDPHPSPNDDATGDYFDGHEEGVRFSGRSDDDARHTDAEDDHA